MKTLTMRAAVRSYEDGHMYDRLQNYCDRMNIQMRTMQINGEVLITFRAAPGQLHELEDHLESVGV